LPTQPSQSPEHDNRLGDVRYDLPPSSLDYITATSDEGDIVYIPLITEEQKEEVDETKPTKIKGERVLSRSIHELIAKVDEKRFKIQSPEKEVPQIQNANTTLFVDKYSPSTFADLLSNEVCKL
jgi:hypothetical protein